MSLARLGRARHLTALRLKVPTVHARPDIPVLVVCRDRLTPLVDLVDWLEAEGMTRIVLLDNDSTYPPLLAYLERSEHEVLRLDNSRGHLAAWDPRVQAVVGEGPYVVTDCDVVPDARAHGAIGRFAGLLNRYRGVDKVGFGLRIDDLPSHYELREQVIAWERQFWQNEVEPGVYRADIDTTFALYRGGTTHRLRPALRTGPHFVARHEPWYVDSRDVPDELRHYRGRARAEVTTWGESAATSDPSRTEIGGTRPGPRAGTAPDLGPNAAVGVVIAHHGDPVMTMRLVEQLREQRTTAPLEIVVSDDRSPIPFPETPGVVVVRRQVNGGFGSAVNSGVEQVTAPMLLVLNSDVELSPTFVTDLCAAAQPLMPAVVGPASVGADGRPEPTARAFPRPRHTFVERSAVLRRWHATATGQRLIGRLPEAVPGTVRRVDWVQGSAMLLPTEIFREVGGFDPTYFMYAEEVDLQRRLAERGVPRYYLGTVSLRHIGGASTDRTRAQEWLVRSQRTYARRWGFEGRHRLAWWAAVVTNLGWSTLRRAAGRQAQPLAAVRREAHLARLAPWPEHRR